MKLSTGIALVVFSIGSMGWQTAVFYGKEKIEDFFNNPFRRSRVPQFLLDARHPWILENQGKLERLPDAESFLCSRPQVSASDFSENGIDIPPNLFEYLEIDNRRAGIKRPGWPNAVLRLREIHRCPAALSQVKTFKTAIWAYRGVYDNLYQRMLEPQQPPTDAYDLFADVLGNMTNLEVLKWDIPEFDANYCEKHFVERGLVLPSVRTLDPRNLFIIRMCPNITALERKGYDGTPEVLIRAATTVPNLKRFAMTVWDGWYLPLIQDLVVNLPGIESVGLWGVRNADYIYEDEADYENGYALTQTLQLLQSLKNLTHLDLPEAYGASVGWGWGGGPTCNRLFVEQQSRENMRIEWRNLVEAADRTAALVVEFLPHLTGFSIGDSQANLTRYENGTLRASFPWTGRIEQWVMECLPLEPDELNAGEALKVLNNGHKG